MFNNLADTIKNLNANLSDVANCEKAKKLRKNLILWGSVACVVGFVGAFICFALFASSSFEMTDGFIDSSTEISIGFPPKVLIPFLLFIPCGALGAVGVKLVRLGLTILVGGVATQFVDNSVNMRCSHCGDTVTNDEIFCSRCGTQVRFVCPNCNTQNSLKDAFCKKCGTKLKK